MKAIIYFVFLFIFLSAAGAQTIFYDDFQDGVVNTTAWTGDPLFLDEWNGLLRLRIHDDFAIEASSLRESIFNYKTQNSITTIPNVYTYLETFDDSFANYTVGFSAGAYRLSILNDHVLSFSTQTSNISDYTVLVFPELELAVYSDDGFLTQTKYNISSLINSASLMKYYSRVVVNTPDFGRSYVDINSFNVSIPKAFSVALRNSDTGDLINTNVTAIIETTTTSELYTFSDGTGFFFNLTNGTTYDLTFISDYGYGSAYYTINYNTSYQHLNAYLAPNGTAISFNLQDVTGAPIDGASVSLYAYVNGFLTLVGQKDSNIVGISRFYPTEERTHVINVTKNGFISRQFSLDLDDIDSPYTITLERTSDYDFARCTEQIIYDWHPRNTQIYPQLTNFSYNISDNLSSLEYFKIAIYNGSNLINQTNGSSSSGGYLNLAHNFSNYTDQTINAFYYYKRDTCPLAYLSYSYYVVNFTPTNGSAVELKTYISDNVDLPYRVAAFSLLMIAFALMAAVFIRGLPNAVITLFVSLPIVWVFGINLLILAIIDLIMFLAIMAFGGRE
jgi:hypothetical protein